MSRTPQFQFLNTELADGTPVTAESDVSPNGQKYWFVYDGHDADTRTARRLAMAARLSTALRRASAALAPPAPPKRKRASARLEETPRQLTESERAHRAAHAQAMLQRLVDHPQGVDGALSALDAYADMLLGK